MFAAAPAGGAIHPPRRLSRHALRNRDSPTPTGLRFLEPVRNPRSPTREIRIACSRKRARRRRSWRAGNSATHARHDYADAGQTGGEEEGTGQEESRATKEGKDSCAREEGGCEADEGHDHAHEAW